MAKETPYRQCLLQRFDENGNKVQTSTWIPEMKDGKKVIVGGRVTLKDPNTKEVLPGDWEVVSVSDQSVSEALAKKRAHNWTDHRKHSDI